MALSFSKADFTNKTKCGFWKHRSPRFKQVLRSFAAYEDKPNGLNVRGFGDAVIAWYKSDPQEFKNRDRKSKGLCTKLIDELKLVTYKNNTLKYSTMELSVARLKPGSRPEVKTTVFKCSMEDFMQGILTQRGQGVAVILIDMQSETMGQKQYEGIPVIEHQKSVLECAKKLGFLVYEIRIVRDGVSYKPKTNAPTVKTLSGSLPQANKLVKIDKPFYSSFEGTSFDRELASRNITDAIVMGYDANTCVANTIFGKPKSKAYTAKGPVDTPYIPGLLERKIRVITSRTVLASGDAALCKEYGFMT